jgi:hypothetical protein
VAEFIERYYNVQRLHSALSCQSPEGFEQSIRPATNLRGATVSFSRHEEIFPSDDERTQRTKPPEDGFSAHRLDESPIGYSSPGWSPPAPDSASPIKMILKHGDVFEKKN